MGDKTQAMKGDPKIIEAKGDQEGDMMTMMIDQ